VALQWHWFDDLVRSLSNNDTAGITKEFEELISLHVIDPTECKPFERR